MLFVGCIVVASRRRIRAVFAGALEMERSNQTLSRLRQLIQRRDFDAGRMPPERVLAGELGVGRRSLRRALDVLEQEGRISRHQGRGTFVNHGPNGEALSERVGAERAGPGERNAVGLSALLAQAAIPAAANLALENILDHTNPLEVIEVRLAIEPVMARLAAFRTSQAEIKLLQALAAETRAAADPVSYEQADARFHRTIAEAARNALFLAIFDTLHASQRDVGWRRLGENAHCYKRQSVYAGFHEEISAAIAERKGDQAQELMQQHLSDVQRYIYQHAFPGVGTAQ
jgi:DNA-binding FadR family transcriptional regulator